MPSFRLPTAPLPSPPRQFGKKKNSLVTGTGGEEGELPMFRDTACLVLIDHHHDSRCGNSVQARPLAYVCTWLAAGRTAFSTLEGDDRGKSIRSAGKAQLQARLTIPEGVVGPGPSEEQGRSILVPSQPTNQRFVIDENNVLLIVALTA